MEKKKKKSRKKKWIRFRHKVVTALAYAVMYPITRLKYRIRIDRYKDKRPHLILLNHQTPFDQFFVGMSFMRALYYVATEDIFSLGFVSSLIRYLVAPIPIKKQTTDLAAVMTCIRIAKEGGSIVIAPEGNRTYSGKTEYMSPVIASLAKKMRLPIALYRIEGGYGAEPRWSDKVRKGPMHAYVSRVIEPEEYATMSDDELFKLIEEGLYVNKAVADHSYRSNRRAEFLDRAMYVCPDCGLSKFHSFKNEITCTKCQRSISYGLDKTLTGVGFDFPFTFVNDWYEYQKSYVNSLDLREYTNLPLFYDKGKLSEVVVYRKKKLLRKECGIALYKDRIVIDEGDASELVFHFDDITTAAVLGRNKVNLYIDQTVYQLKGDKHFNALKYVNLYYRYQNITKGDCDGKFLGL